LSISGLYLIGWLPSSLIGIIQQFTSWNSYAQMQSNYTLPLIYLVCPLLPWIYRVFQKSAEKFFVNISHINQLIRLFFFII